MTLPLPAIAAPEPVRWLNPLCRRWLRDSEYVEARELLKSKSQDRTDNEEQG